MSHSENSAQVPLSTDKDEKSRHDARATLATLVETRRSCTATIERVDAKCESAQQALSDIRDTLKKIDDMKARWGEVLDKFARRVAESMQEEESAAVLDGSPPTGKLAHGFDAPDGLEDPKRVVECAEIARPNMSSGILSHEYRDSGAALSVKVKVLAGMLRRAKCSAFYTGAGISTAAGIRDYASKAGARSSVLPKRVSDATPFKAGSAINAEPTFSHRAIAELHRHGLLRGGWVNQNHDSLAQKAGVPQCAVNEIHGSWFDASNPVVPMSGRLRPDLVQRLNDTLHTADLVIAMGTSLSGVSADRLVSGIGHGRRRGVERVGQSPGATSTSKALAAIAEEGADEAAVDGMDHAPIGAVIINVQQTRLDSCAALRIFATCDEVMRRLLVELGIKVDSKLKVASTERVADNVWTGLPYDGESGERLPKGAAPSTLDLSCGRRVKLADGNSPMAPVGLKGSVGKLTVQGHYTIHFDDGTLAHLGCWMLTAAKRGELERLPLVADRA